MTKNQPLHKALHKAFSNFYRDSVTLMQLSSKITSMDGVKMASALMGTPSNMQMMIDAGLLSEVPVGISPSDLLLVVALKDDAVDGDNLLKNAVDHFTALLTEDKVKSKSSAEKEVHSIAEALQDNPDATLVLISVPGEYAGAEAMKALRQGLNVMIFSDSVPEHQEIELKKYATDHDLLVMGPDCGTAIIDGVPLAFANVVRSGAIGVVGASGTGTQEVTTIVHQLGEGISYAIGTGGHDLSAKVGGLTMIAGLKGLIADDNTKVIVLVSKPPAKEVAEKVLALAKTANKPVVVCFLGGDEQAVTTANLVGASTLEEAAHRAVQIYRKSKPDFKSVKVGDTGIADKIKKNTGKGQKYLRGLYSGGTFCYEALLMLQDELPDISSNIPTGKIKPLADRWQSVGHTLVDLGDDEFTHGKPHPMIDPSGRNERLLKEAADKETAVILFDVVIGYGANQDPAGEIVKAVEEGKKIAAKDGREIVFVGFVCGTDKDPQNYATQKEILINAGVIVCQSNAHAVATAGTLIKGIL